MQSLRLVLSTCLLLWICSSSLFASGKSCHRGFIVFAGQDAKGKVAFAMENTRSEGDWWDWTQASQSAWLYDEKTGWVKLKNRFGNPFDGGKGTRIGGEWQYQFTGGFQPKMTIHSDENGIHLNLKADQVVLKAREPHAQMVVANGEGALTWKGRRITGKVYLRDEHHQGKGSADIYFQNAKGMHREALHVCIKGRGMMSMVRTNSRDYAPLGGELGLSLLLDTLSGMGTDVQIEATAYKRFGLMAYPTEWQGNFSIDGRQAMFKLTSLDYQTTEYLLVAGTRLGWARGFLCFDGETHEIFGLAEVEGHLEGRKEIQEAEWRARPAEEEAPGSSWEAVVRGK